MGIVRSFAAMSLLGVTGLACADVTFSISAPDEVYWDKAWVAQSLYYAQPVLVNSIIGVFKDGAVNNNYTFEVFTACDAAGNFSGKIAEKTMTIIPNSAATTILFDAPLILSGSPDNMYYLKWSPTEGGLINQFIQWGDDGSDPLRMGSAGHIFFNDSIAFDAPLYRYDAWLVIDTTVIPEPMTVSLLALGSLAALRRRR